MNSHVRKWGNSPAIRIPLPLMAEARLAVDQPVEIRVEDGRIVIEPSTRRPRYNLADLVAGITPDNIHPETDWGPDVGAEIIDD